MSLRRRLLLAVAAAMLASFAIGSWITAWQAAQMVRAELTAALHTGRESASGTLQDLGPAPGGDALARLIRGFDGSRHVVASLMQHGVTVARSRPAAPEIHYPAWFGALVTPRLAPVDLPVRGGMVDLAPTAAGEIVERWAETRRMIWLTGLSALLAGGLCFATAAWSLRPLATLAQAFRRLETGNPPHKVAEDGPPEIAHLSLSFNRMQDALARAAQENRRLSEQIERLAEEERVELARDLHDEIGPLLFALTAWASAARIQAEAGDSAATLNSLRALEGSGAGLQAAVRGLLVRLRDSGPAASDFSALTAGLTGFWRAIRPQTAFHTSIDRRFETVAEPVRAALFRVAQEGVANAIRHGDATEVTIEATLEGEDACLSVADNGVANHLPGTGFGLAGLEERLLLVGGMLKVIREPGWKIIGRAPAMPRGVP